jgi:hypothetical protein
MSASVRISSNLALPTELCLFDGANAEEVHQPSLTFGELRLDKPCFPFPVS